MLLLVALLEEVAVSVPSLDPLPAVAVAAAVAVVVVAA
jgi:preprotein translocase subunit Sec61beta